MSCWSICWRVLDNDALEHKRVSVVVCMEKEKEDVEEDVEEKNRGRSCLSHKSQLMQYHAMPSLCVYALCVCMCHLPRPNHHLI